MENELQIIREQEIEACLIELRGPVSYTHLTLPTTPYV